MPTMRGDDPALRKQVVAELVRRNAEAPMSPRSLRQNMPTMLTNAIAVPKARRVKRAKR